MEIVKEDMTTPGLTVTKMTDEATGENLELDMEILREEDMITPRPTADHPRDKFGQFPGYVKARCKVVPIGREQTKNVCEELNKITEKISNEEFKRNICSTELSERNELEQHKKTHHVVFTCDACKKQFPDGNGLNQHLRQYHQDPHVIGNTTNLTDGISFNMTGWLRQQEQIERGKREEREEREERIEKEEEEREERERSKEREERERELEEKKERRNRKEKKYRREKEEKKEKKQRELEGKKEKIEKEEERNW